MTGVLPENVVRPNVTRRDARAMVVFAFTPAGRPRVRQLGGAINAAHLVRVESLDPERCEERHDALAELKLPGVKDVLFGERFRHRGLPGSLLALDEAVAHNVARDQRPGG